MKKLLILLLILAAIFSGCAPASNATDAVPTTAPLLEDPYIGISKETFYKNYTPASSYQDAQYRTKHGLLSGSLEIPGQYLERTQEQPMAGSRYIRNGNTRYDDDGNTYIVTDSQGKEVMRIYKGGAYITLEEVAAYMFAFGGEGSFPANYVSKKSTKPQNSNWGQYLRVNHSYYSNNTRSYPYEPELPGDHLRYYEMDIGTTGTVTPGYNSKLYNDGTEITRGAARLVYARQDLNGNGYIEENEIHVFYTHNHYNDFTEYLNYYGGWGETFGNITGGGEFDSKTNCNPTPYVPTLWQPFV